MFVISTEICFIVKISNKQTALRFDVYILLFAVVVAVLIDACAMCFISLSAAIIF